MDKKEALQVLLRTACIYIGTMQQDMSDKEVEEYLEIKRAMEVLKNG
jgi:hypothetical protein